MVENGGRYACSLLQTISKCAVDKAVKSSGTRKSYQTRPIEQSNRVKFSYLVFYYIVGTTNFNDILKASNRPVTIQDVLQTRTTVEISNSSEYS